MDLIADRSYTRVRPARPHPWRRLHQKKSRGISQEEADMAAALLQSHLNVTAEGLEEENRQVVARLDLDGWVDVNPCCLLV